jgi:regulatory protein
LLATREHSRLELRQKLVQRQTDPALLEQVLDQLQRAGLQSDQRYTETFIESRIAKGQGPIRIGQELKERGIGAELIDRCLEIHGESWRPLLLRVHSAKFGQEPARDNKALAKQARFLAYRGFTDEMIRQFLFD